MKQFEQLYFRLVGIEQFQQGVIYRIEKVGVYGIPVLYRPRFFYGINTPMLNTLFK